MADSGSSARPPAAATQAADPSLVVTNQLAKHTTLDPVDRAVLGALAKDARRSARSIGRELKMSVGLVLSRIDRLEKAGVIRSYRVEVDPEKTGFGLTGFATIQLSGTPDVEETLDFLMTIPEIDVVHWVGARFDILVTLRVRDVAHLQDVMLRKLRRCPGYLRGETLISLAHRRRIGGQFAFVWTEETADVRSAQPGSGTESVGGAESAAEASHESEPHEDGEVRLSHGI